MGQENPANHRSPPHDVGMGAAELSGHDLHVQLTPTGQLHSLLHATGHEFVTPGGEGALWRLHLQDAQGRRRLATASDAASYRCEPCGPGVRLTWSEIEGAPQLQVVATVVPDGRFLSFRLSVEGLAPETALREVEFPVLSDLTLAREPVPRCGDGRGLEERLVIPHGGGFVVQDPGAVLAAAEAAQSATNEESAAFATSYPGSLSMQFTALYREQGVGLLVMTLDPEGNYKRFLTRFQVKYHRWTLAVEHTPAGMPRTSGRYDLPYAVAITAFSGSWQDAAGIYKSWATTQPWCHKGPLHARTDLPDWLLDTGLWVWNRGRSEQVLPGALALQRAVDAPIALDWYWWHQTPYDTFFPDYLPPREGSDSFVAALDRLHRQGGHAIVYVNGRLWGTGAASWSVEDAERSACKLENGELYREVYNIFNQAEMAPMCPATALWREKLTGIVGELVNDYGLDGVYIDQIGTSAPRLCFDADHGHPAGGGHHWHQGYRQLIEEVRRATEPRPNTMLPTEGCCEMYLDLFDAFLVLDNSFERMGFYGRRGLSWEPVPLFSAVYHEYALHFGSYASLTAPPYDELWPRPDGPPRSSQYDERDFAAAFFAELGRAFVAGAQPMVANVQPELLEDPELAQHWHFLKELVRVRLQAAPFLLLGRWLGAPPVTVPETTVDFLVRGIYTRPDGEHVVRRKLPGVLASSWESADGRLGLALANISSEAHSIPWHLDGLQLGQPIYRISGTGRELAARASGPKLVYSTDVPARSVQFLETGKAS